MNFIIFIFFLNRRLIDILIYISEISFSYNWICKKNLYIFSDNLLFFGHGELLKPPLFAKIKLNQNIILELRIPVHWDVY